MSLSEREFEKLEKPWNIRLSYKTVEKMAELEGITKMKGQDMVRDMIGAMLDTWKAKGDFRFPVSVFPSSLVSFSDVLRLIGKNLSPDDLKRLENLETSTRLSVPEMLLALIFALLESFEKRGTVEFPFAISQASVDKLQEPPKQHKQE
jgi:hypothetical protein